MCWAILSVRYVIIPVVRHLVSKLSRKDHHFTHNPNGIPDKCHVRLIFMRFENKDKDNVGFAGTSLHFPKGVNGGSTKGKQIAFTRKRNFRPKS